MIISIDNLDMMIFGGKNQNNLIKIRYLYEKILNNF